MLRAGIRNVDERWKTRLIPKVLCASMYTASTATQPVRLQNLVQDARSAVNRCKQRVGRVMRALVSPHSSVGLLQPYRLFASCLRRWPLTNLHSSRHGRSSAPEAQVAFVLWRYPLLSQTFVRREVQGLRDCGLPVKVFALEPDDPPLATDPHSPAGEVHYFGPAGDKVGRAFVLECLRRHPWTVIGLCLYLVGHNHHGAKTWWRDRDVLYLAGQLAAALAAHRVTHVHSAWADQYALVSFVAARMLGITFSAQARAFELHRSVERSAIADRLRFAEFVVTNPETFVASVIDVGPGSSQVVTVDGLADGSVVVPVQFNGHDASVSTQIACDTPVCTDGVLTTVTDDKGVQHQACVASAAVDPAPAPGDPPAKVTLRSSTLTTSPQQLPSTGSGTTSGLVIAAVLVGSGSVASLLSRRKP